MHYAVKTSWEKYDTVESAKALLGGLDSCVENITSLDIGKNTYTPSVFAEVAGRIRKMKKLRSFRAESFLDSLHYEEMCEVVSLLSEALPLNLVSLELPSNALSCKFPEALERFISEANLHVLALNDCGLGQIGMDRVVEALKKRKNKSNLISLDFSKNRINKLSCEFGPVLTEFTNLQELKLRNNTIEKQSIAKFFGSYSGKQLQVLDVSDNFICGECIEPLSRLIGNIQLTQLYLQDAKMKEGEINVVLKALCNMRTKELPGSLNIEKPELILDISCISFEQDSVHLLIALADKFFLKRLIIFENDYTDITELKKRVMQDGGVVIDVEEELDTADPIAAETEEILERIGHL